MAEREGAAYSMVGPTLGRQMPMLPLFVAAAFKLQDVAVAGRICSKAMGVSMAVSMSLLCLRP